MDTPNLALPGNRGGKQAHQRRNCQRGVTPSFLSPLTARPTARPPARPPPPNTKPPTPGDPNAGALQEEAGPRPLVDRLRLDRRRGRQQLLAHVLRRAAEHLPHHQGPPHGLPYTLTRGQTMLPLNPELRAFNPEPVTLNPDSPPSSL